MSAEPAIAWDADLELAIDLARGDARYESGFLETSVRGAVLARCPERIGRIRIVDFDDVPDAPRMLVYAEHAAGAATEFLTLAPGEDAWRVAEDVGRLRSPRGWAFVARRDGPGAAPWYRLSGTRPSGAAPDEVVVQRDSAPMPWQVERLLLAAEDPAYAASLGASWFEPRYERIELVQLSEAPAPRRADRARLGDGLRRAPWKARRLAVDAFAERYARDRGLELLPDAEAPPGTWFLDGLTRSRSHAVMRGTLETGTYGTLYYGQRALHSGGRTNFEDWTVAVVAIPRSQVAIDDFACRAPREEIPGGLREIPIGDARLDERYVLANATAARADGVSSYFTGGFADWLAGLPCGEAGEDVVRFEVRGQTICVYAKGLLDTSEALDAHCRATARIAGRFG